MSRHPAGPLRADVRGAVTEWQGEVAGANSGLVELDRNRTRREEER